MSGTATLEHVLELKRTRRWDEAVIALEGVLARSPSNPVALTHLAEVQLRRRRLAEAADALERAEALAGTTAFTARVRGDLRYREQRWRDAARCYADADALGDRGTWSLVQLARCHLRLNELEAARGAASRAVERNDSEAAAWVALGEVAQREGRDEDAVTLFERAHERAPKDEFAYAKLIEARVLRLAPEEREREVEVLLRSQDRGNRHLMGVLAKLRSQGGDDRQAAETWRARRKLHGDLFSRKMEGYALRKAGELEEAAAVLRSCLLEDPEDLVLFRTFVHLQRSRGALDDLRSTLEELVPLAGGRRGAVYGELRKLGPA
ncbi:MAG: tetratricopeptide repeat protein [Actinomycetota bacterium]|nr:tetratricopeptide repeat protein [Actinomycetota bacterium]